MKFLKPTTFTLLLVCSLFATVGCAETHFSSTKNAEQAGETIVLIHGLGRSNVSMWMMDHRLEKAGYEVVRVGYNSLTQTPEEILQQVSDQINDCCARLQQPVHFVGHSLGGLMIRAYLVENQVAHLGRVVLIGTPNTGTPVVDLFQDKWWMKLAGPTAMALGTQATSFPNSLPKPDYPVGVIAGIVERGPMTKKIPGDDDGLVPVESTRVEGMRDFVVIDTNHTMMRYDDEVLRQTIAFLRNGAFDQPSKPDASPEQN